MEIPEGALDKFRGGAEFIAGTRVFPPKMVVCSPFLATATKFLGIMLLGAVTTKRCGSLYSIMQSY